MRNKFKYDYNNKLFFINLLLSVAFLILSILLFKKIIAFILCLIITILSTFNSFFVIRNQGIKIVNEKNIFIFDQFLFRKLCIDNIKYVSVRQIPKETKSKIYGFFNEFFYPSTYISKCNYVYNQGKVYDICFYMNNGTVVKSYFGWLYREKKKTINKVEKKLLDFIERINILCKKNRAKSK